jgi:hypothetical protein
MNHAVPGDRIIQLNSLFTCVFRPTPRSTHPLILWVSGALSLGVKREGREADHSPPSIAEVKKGGAMKVAR